MSNDTNTPKNRPTHRVYSVTPDAGGTSKWTEIGAAWPHKDRQGFNLKLTALPAAGAEMVLRVTTAKKATGPSRD
jgi:hypothetical protein